MAKYHVVITKSVQRTLGKLSDRLATQLEDAMLSLEDNPRPPGCKKLKGRAGYRIRVGDYRIIYEIQDKILVVTVLEVGNRRDVYN